jgi:uncharacterized protein HemX
MSYVKSKSILFVGLAVSSLLATFSAVGYSVYTFQQQKIDRLQAENQVLQQQIAKIQTTNAQLQQTNTELTTANTTLTADLQVVCQRTHTRFLVFLQQKLDALLERDFAQQWQQICQRQSITPQP